jgi:muconolactone delta-isomerase
MLFLTISTPAPNKPSTVNASRQKFWRWIDPHLESGTAKSVYARPGRGAVVVFDVESNEALHALLTEWAEMIPATFELFPLIDPKAAERYLKKQPARKK